MLRLLHHPEDRDQYRPHRDQGRANDGGRSEGIPQDQAGEESVENEGDGAEG